MMIPHQGMFALIFKAALFGFTVGLLLAVPAASWVWLEMRVNVGLLIPMAVFLCLFFAFWKRKAFSYSLFLMTQFLLFLTLLMIYGLDAGALWSVPASLFREGFYCAGVALKTAGLLTGGILLGGNLLWIAVSRERPSSRMTTNGNSENISYQ